MRRNSMIIGGSRVERLKIIQSIVESSIANEVHTVILDWEGELAGLKHLDDASISKKNDILKKYYKRIQSNLNINIYEFGETDDENADRDPEET